MFIERTAMRTRRNSKQNSTSNCRLYCRHEWENTPTTLFHSKTKQINERYNNILTLPLLYYLRRMFTGKLRCVLFEIPNKTQLVTVGPLILSSRNIERMSDIIIYLHYIFSITCGECLLRDLRCVLFEIPNKTQLVTVGPLILSSRNERYNNILTLPLLYYLRRMFTGKLRCVLFEIPNKTQLVTVGPLILSSRNERYNNILTLPLLYYLRRMFTARPAMQCLLRDLRCVLVEIQSKTKLVTVGPLILSSRRYNNIFTLPLLYYLRRTFTARPAMRTLRNSKQNSTSNCLSRSKIRLCCRHEWESIPTWQFKLKIT
ncbi:LOW QUALITY PROTEIN: hypothetical protein V1477_015756 [Vespula maculifrons]|uniref:Maturase K n=1 Tax=Vespula maculifrons TaxID=7453 RepID=A0ABD2BBA5_VESMC